jgi:hypothetical protein
MNAQAGVGCYSWGPGTVTYVFMVDLDDSLNIYWKGESIQLRLTWGRRCCGHNSAAFALRTVGGARRVLLSTTLMSGVQH